MNAELCICDNGITVQYIDMGVEYGYMGRTLQFIGEYSDGEISISDKNHVIGRYERVEDGDVTEVTLEDGRTFQFDSEEACEAFAKQLLSE